MCALITLTSNYQRHIFTKVLFEDLLLSLELSLQNDTHNLLLKFLDRYLKESTLKEDSYYR